MLPTSPSHPPRLARVRSAIVVLAVLASTLSSGSLAVGAAPQLRTATAVALSPVNVRLLARTKADAHEPTPRPVPRLSLPARAGAPQLKGAAQAPAAPLVRVASPGFFEQTAFGGMADSAGGGSTSPTIEPPDPWVAVGPSHVVQAVNTRLRFSTRLGAQLAEVSLVSFFGENSQAIDGDARVLYDKIHGRWVASELSADCSTGHLRLAVSDSNDPTSSWHRWVLNFPGQLPDYPGLGFSSDKVALSANRFAWSGCAPGAFIDGYFAVLDWADLLAGTSTFTYKTLTSPTVDTWRPAPNLTSDPVLHLIGEGSSGEVFYLAVTGTNHAGNTDFTGNDLTGAGIVDSFLTPPQPIDPLGQIGPTVLDSRPTDAVWQSGHLWFVSTYPHTYDGGATFRDVVRITEIATAGSVSVVQDVLLGDAGFDAFYGGIGLTSLGGAFIVMAESSASSPVSLLVGYQRPSAPNTIAGFRTLATGLAGYKGDRWGDYVGVATDPVYPHAVWQAGEFANSVGSWSTRVSKLTEDAVAPTITSRSPLANAVNVGVSPTVTAVLSEAVTGVDATSMALSNVADFVNLAATVSYNPSTRTATLHPAAPLQEGATYRVAMSGRIKDLSGNALAWTTWTFSTGAPTTFKRGTHTGYKFNSTGGVIGIKTFTLASDSAASAGGRGTVTNQSGMWLTITSGLWAGYRIRESSVVYLNSMPISPPAGANMKFSPAVPLTFLKGTHTGYKFDSAGAVTGEKTFTLGSTSYATTVSRSTTSTQSGKWFLVSGGVWAGYWLLASEVVFLKP